MLKALEIKVGYMPIGGRACKMKNKSKVIRLDIVRASRPVASTRNRDNESVEMKLITTYKGRQGRCLYVFSSRMCSPPFSKAPFPFASTIIVLTPHTYLQCELLTRRKDQETIISVAIAYE